MLVIILSCFFGMICKHNYYLYISILYLYSLLKISVCFIIPFPYLTIFLRWIVNCLVIWNLCCRQSLFFPYPWHFVYFTVSWFIFTCIDGLDSSLQFFCMSFEFSINTKTSFVERNVWLLFVSVVNMFNYIRFL